MANYVVTGGATGIGRAIADALRAQGHAPIIVDIKNADIVADLSTPDGRAAAAAAIADRIDGRLDGLVTSAGVGAHVPDAALIASLNYFGSIELVDALTEQLAAASGCVVLVASESAFNSGLDPEYLEALFRGDEGAARARVEQLDPAARGFVAYAGSKHGIVHWMRHRTAELAAKRVRINAIAPGYTETPLTEEAKDSMYGEAMAAFAESIPLGRPGTPADMAAGAMFLMSPEASFVTGSTLHIDGGHDAIQRPDRVD